MHSLKERYASAVNSSNLAVKTDTTYGDVDCLIAFGLTARHYPLGVALQRLFVDGKAKECVELMAEMARDRSYKIRERLTILQSTQLAQQVLAWYRHGVCQDCGGTGKEVIIEPKPHLSDEDCHSCRGTGRRPFEANFTRETVTVALWLKNEVSKHQAMAGRAAMECIAPSLDL